jgi:hypothetical protein
MTSGAEGEEGLARKNVPGVGFFVLCVRMLFLCLPSVDGQWVARERHVIIVPLGADGTFFATKITCPWHVNVTEGKSAFCGW